MAQFIALAARNYDGFSEADFAPLLEPEGEAVRALFAAGVVRAAWGRKDIPGAVLLLEADSLEAAQAAVDTLPLKQRGMLTADIVPVGPYRAFGPRG